jgi:hypothetical protein
MGEVLPQATADVLLTGHANDLAEKIIATCRAPVVGRVQSEVTALATDIIDAVNNWMVNGRSTTETAGPGVLATTHQDGLTPTQEVSNVIGPWCRDMAEKVYAHVRARDVTRVQSEVEVLVTDLVNAINTWLATTPTAETAGTGSPFNVNL